MKIKNLNLNAENLKKALKKTSIVLVAGAMITTAPITSLTTKVEASSYAENYDVMYYFTSNLQNNVDKYLEKDLTSSNLNKLLGYYDTLYDYINNNKYVRSTYFNNLNTFEQENLKYLLNTWENEIYEMYRSKSYFQTNCKNQLGFYLTYSSQEVGYDSDHEKTMKYFTETLNNQLENLLDNSNSQTNLTSALKVYQKLVKFIQGNSRIYGYIYSELTQTEQTDITMLIENWTRDIEYEYGNYSYYSSICTNKNYGIGWTVNSNNLYTELGKYMGINNGVVNAPIYTPIVPNVQTTPSVTVPNQNQIITPNVNNTQQVVTPSVNNTIGKNWHQSYEDPSVNYYQKDERDYTPEYVDEYNNNYYYDDYYYYNDEYYRYPQDYYYNEEEYIRDYVPTYILK